MTSADADTIKQLRLADRSLRRYAVHLVGDHVDDVLFNAYITAIQNRLTLLDGDRASFPLYREVQARGAARGVVEEDEEAEDLQSALWSLPIEERSALLLTTLAGMTQDQAGEVLGVSAETIANHASFASSAIRQRVPGLADADAATLERTVADLPVPEASPQFWPRLEVSLPLVEPTPSTLEPTIVTVQSQPPTSGPIRSDEKLWPPLLVGLAALILVVLLFVSIVSGGDDTGDVAADDTTVVPTSASPLSSTTAPPPTSPSSTAPATSATQTIQTTLGETTATTATETVTSSPGGVGGTIRHRGEILPGVGVVVIEGTVEPGEVEIWETEIEQGQSLAIAVTGLNGAVLTAESAGGSPLAPDYADPGLHVYTTPGVIILRFSADPDLPVSYSVGAGLSGPEGGFLTNFDELGVAVSTLGLTSCAASSDRIEATLELINGGGQELAVTFESLTEVGSITWTDSDVVTGIIQSTSSIPTGLVFGGDISGPEPLAGLPFWTTLYGCL